MGVRPGCQAAVWGTRFRVRLSIRSMQVLNRELGSDGGLDRHCLRLGIESLVIAQDAPRDAGELIGQRDCKFVPVQSLRCAQAMVFSANDGSDVGEDSGAPVSPDSGAWATPSLEESKGCSWPSPRPPRARIASSLPWTSSASPWRDSRRRNNGGGRREASARARVQIETENFANSVVIVPWAFCPRTPDQAQGRLRSVEKAVKNSRR